MRLGRLESTIGRGDWGDLRVLLEEETGETGEYCWKRRLESTVGKEDILQNYCGDRRWRCEEMHQAKGGGAYT